MLTSSVQFATRASPQRLQHVDFIRAVTISGCPGVRPRQQVRGFRLGAPRYHFHSRPCRKGRRKTGTSRHHSAEKNSLFWPFGDSFLALESTYRALEKWSKSGLGTLVNEPHQERTPASDQEQRRHRDGKKTGCEPWTHRRFYKDQCDAPKHPPNRRQEPSSKDQAFQAKGAQSQPFIIDPITNRKVSLENHNFVSIRQHKARAEQKNLDQQLNSSDTTQTLGNASGQRPGSEAHSQDGQSERKTASLESGSRQTTPRYSDLHKYRPIIDDVSVLDTPLDQRTHELDGRPANAHLQFNDLKPPPSQPEKSISMSADEAAYLLGSIEARDDGTQDRATSETAASTNEHSQADTIVTQILRKGHMSDQQDPSPAGTRLENDEISSDRKPAGYVEETVAPENIHEYPCIIEQTKPGDFPLSTIDNLRQKYGDAEVKKYTAVRCQEQNGQSSSPTERESTDDERPTQHEQVTINEHGHEHSLSGRPGKIYESIPVEPSSEILEKLRERQVDESVNPKYRAWLESMEQLSDAVRQDEVRSDAADREAALAVREAKARVEQQRASQTKLTGNFVRDFPEEFEKSWTQTLSSVPTETFDTPDQQTALSEGQSMDGGLEGGFASPEPSKIQPALDRHRKARGAADNDAESLYTRYDDRVAGPGEVDNRHSGATTQELGRAHESSIPSGTSATLYKILAYDSTSQTVNIAETSSLVGDFTSSLTPAAALSHLSHPTKFFPHFASLEADGFEIVSGSGDVLVFRKARLSAAEQEASKAAETDRPADAATSEPYQPVNPIDMTGRPRFMTPASANFASPTGYVAYPETEAANLPPPPQRIKYNIDVRREEPVYSGPKTKSYGGQERQKKDGLGKRLLVGGVWVAGISYGLGVVSEYFTTGGVDGTGPAGF